MSLYDVWQVFGWEGLVAAGLTFCAFVGVMFASGRWR